MNPTWLLLILGVASGALIPVQAASNAALSRQIQGNVPFVALLVFLVAAAATASGMLALRISVPALADLRSAPWWSYTGGLVVAFYVFTITFLSPKLGVGTAISLIVAGQVLSALAIDHFGLLRSLTFPLSATRLSGAALLIIGVFLALKR